MELAMLLQIGLSALTNASVYGLIGFGLVLVYRGTGVLNFGIGYVAAAGGLVYASHFGSSGGVSGLLLGAVAGALLGAATYLLVIRWAQKRGAEHLELAVATLGVGLLIYFVAGLLWPKRAITGPPLVPGGQTLAGVTASNQRLLVVAVTILLVVAFAIFFERTMAGWTLQAVAHDRVTAGAYGVPVTSWLLVIWSLGGAFAGLAGGLITPVSSISRDMGIPLVLKGLTAAVVGGLRTMYGPLVGALLVAFAETLFIIYVSSTYAQAFTFLLLAITLIVRPQGIFSRGQEAERV